MELTGNLWHGCGASNNFRMACMDETTRVERAILAHAMDDDRFARWVAKLPVPTFQGMHHRVLHAAIAALVEEDEPVDEVTCHGLLKQSLRYLHRLHEDTP